MEQRLPDRHQDTRGAVITHAHTLSYFIQDLTRRCQEPCPLLCDHNIFFP